MYEAGDRVKIPVGNAKAAFLTTADSCSGCQVKFTKAEMRAVPYGLRQVGKKIALHQGKKTIFTDFSMPPGNKGFELYLEKQ